MSTLVTISTRLPSGQSPGIHARPDTDSRVHDAQELPPLLTFLALMLALLAVHCP